MKVLLEIGQRGIDMPNSCMQASLQEVTVIEDNVEYVSLVLLEHQPVILPEKVAAPSKPIPTILPT